MDTNKIKKLFLHEWQSKLVSLFLAITLWFYVTYLKNQVEYSVSLPLAFKNLPSELIIVDANTHSANIRITVRKNDKEIRDYSKLFAASVDLSGAQTGRHSYLIILKPNDPKLKIKARLIKDQVSLKIDKKISKTLPIKAQIIGTPCQGYVLDDIQLSRHFINVTGPKSVLDSIQQLETGPVDISEASNSIETSSSLTLPPLTVSKYKKNIKIKLIISERVVHNSYDFKLRLHGLLPGLSFSGPKRVNLEIQVPGRYLENLDKIVLPVLDLSRFRQPGHYSATLKIQAPDSVIIHNPARSINFELKKTAETH